MLHSSFGRMTEFLCAPRGVRCSPLSLFAMLALSRVAAAARRLPRLLHTSVPLRERATRRSQLLAKELTKAGSISELVRMHTDYRAGIGHGHMPTTAMATSTSTFSDT